MADRNPPSVDVIAMHGWASDARCWAPWFQPTASLGWRWQCGERGYGNFEPRQPAWPGNARSTTMRLFIAHSLGPHLVAPGLLARADAIVLLASFGTFVPPGRAGRRVRRAMAAMADKLGCELEAREMLHNFLANAASPESSALLPPGPADGPLTLERLREDLAILGDCRGLPPGFPGGARVLIVEAGRDTIVDPEACAMLREALPEATVIPMEKAGHSLLQTNVIEAVTAWVEGQRAGLAAQNRVR